jgi:carboxyl-terminal processing protease
MKKLTERNLHFVILAFFTGLFLGIHFAFSASASESGFRYLDHFHKAYQIIRSDYVDESDPRTMFHGAINGMIRSLNDPFSRFLNEQSFKELTEMTTGKFVGVGVEITEKEGQIVVITPIDESPAMHAGIMSGDIITKVNGTEIKTGTITETVSMIKGIPGSTVKLHIRRDGYPELLEFDIERLPIKLKSCDYGTIKDYSTGYIRIINFGMDTGKEVEKALTVFNKEKLDKVIIDLRYNPGGLLSSAVEISEMILNKGDKIVGIKGRKGSGNETEYVSKKDPIYKGKLVLLINKGSASASEIIAGAVRDNKRGILIGEKTFGKASVQKTYNLEENIGLAVTVAKYYTPSGELIHQKGIQPHKEIKITEFSEKDKYSLVQIEKNKIIEKFVTKDTAYNEKTRNGFYSFLKENDVPLSPTTADYILKTRLGKFVKKPLYDIEFDNQLKYALENINEK